MAIQKFKMYITVGTGRYTHGQISLQDYKPSSASADSDFGKRTLGEVEVEVDIPEFDLVLIEIDALEQAVQKERADSQVRVNLLLDRLSKLKAIGHDAPVGEGV